MEKFSKYIDRIYALFMSDKSRATFEKVIFLIAILVFVVQSGAILLVNLGILPKDFYSHAQVMPDPLSSIYTPFSIILLYEIYLLIYYLPKSITIYLGKQYEVITLILIRRIFEDLSILSASQNGYDMSSIAPLLWTFGGLIVLVLLIFCFYKLSGKRKPISIDECDDKRRHFITIKKILALLLFVLFVILFFAGFLQLKDFHSIRMSDVVSIVKSMSYLFFNTFFVALILIEVLLLLFTFNLSDKFSKVVRNSGFIISTILLKLSFRSDGGISIVFILTAVAFGVIILGISRLFEKKLIENNFN